MILLCTDQIGLVVGLSLANISIIIIITIVIVVVIIVRRKSSSKVSWFKALYNQTACHLFNDQLINMVTVVDSTYHEFK